MVVAVPPLSLDQIKGRLGSGIHGGLEKLVDQRRPVDVQEKASLSKLVGMGRGDGARAQNAWLEPILSQRG